MICSNSGAEAKFRPQALFYHINDVKSIFSGVIYVKSLLLFFMNGGLFFVMCRGANTAVTLQNSL